MSGVDPPEGEPPGEETRAFQRYYLSGERDTQRRGLLYRLLIGWWRDRA